MHHHHGHGATYPCDYFYSLPRTVLLLSCLLLSCLAVIPVEGIDIYVSFYPVPLLNATFPTPRCLHYTAPSDLQASFYVVAGRPSEPNDSYLSSLNDVWSFTARSGTPAFAPTGSWSALGVAPWLPRMALTGSSTNVPVTKSAAKSVVLIYGGVSSGGVYLDDIWQYDSAPADGSAPSWSQIRQLSSTRTPATAATLAAPHIVQPSARAFMTWQSLTLPYSTLTALANTALATQNLRSYLATSGSSASSGSTVTVLTLFGGRSLPTNNYSTTWTTRATAVTKLTNTTALNADYADLWWYLPAADTFIRVGNLTCLNSTYTCADWMYMPDVVDAATGTSLIDQVTDIATNFSAQVRPDSLEAEVRALYNLVSTLNDTLYDTLSFLMSLPPNSSYEQNVPNACAQSCSALMEVPAPTPASTGCTLGVITGTSGCPFYFPYHTSLGVTITQQRPNATEGYSSAVYTGSAGKLSNFTFAVYFQFGGFQCAGQHPGVSMFTVYSYDAICLSNTLYALDTSTGTPVWWALNPPGPSSGSGQLVLWPSPRAYSSMAIDSSRGQLWVYGGTALLGGQWQYYSDLHVFDVVKVQWLRTNVVGAAPPGTFAMSLFFSTLNTNAQRLVLFGGCGSNNPLSSNTVYTVQTNVQVQASNWLLTGNATTSITAGQLSAISATAVVSALIPTRLMFAQGLADLWVVSLSVYDGSGAKLVVQPTSPSVDETGGGGYTFNFTVYQGRTAVLTVYYYEYTTATAVQLAVSPFTITVQPGPYSPHTSALLYSNYSVVAKLLPTSLTLQLRDTWNNPCLASQGAVPFTLAYVSASDQSTNNTAARVPLPLDVSDNGDGTYTLTYTAPDISSYYLYVSVASTLLQGSPFQVTALNPLAVPGSIQVALLVVSCVVGGAVVVMLAALVYHRNNRVVRAGSPLFLALICVGVLISVSSVPVYAYQSSVSCRLFPLLLTTGYVVALSALFTKSYRVLLIFVRHQLHSMALTDSAMMGLVFVLVSCETILNLIWLISDPLTLGTYQDSSEVLTYRACGGHNATAFISASVAFNGLIALWGVWLALQIRHVPEAFSESKLMGAALYNLALVMAITIPLTWTASNTQSSHEDLIIPSAAILWCSVVTVMLVIAPKLYYVLNPPPQHFFDGYPNSGVMVKGVKGRHNGHGPDNGGGGHGGNAPNGNRSWSDERHDAAEAAGFDVRRGGAPPAKRWKKNAGQPAAARRPGDEEAGEKADADGAERREGPEVEMRAMKGNPVNESAAAVAAVPAILSSAAAPPAVMQPLMVEDAPAGFHGDNRRNSFSDRRRPAPIRTSVPAALTLAPPVGHHSARSRSRHRTGGSRTVALPHRSLQGGSGLVPPVTSGSSSSGGSGGGATRLHSPAVLQANHSASSSSPPSSHSRLSAYNSPQLPSPGTGALAGGLGGAQHPSPVSRPSPFGGSMSVNERASSVSVAG